MNEEQMELAGPIVATEEPNEAATQAAIADLDKRIHDLEAALGDLRTVKAQSAGAAGSKTGPSASLMAKGEASAMAAGIDDALRSLSVEQRIAVKSGLMRAGLLA